MAQRPEVDTETPSVARVYDAALGGKDHFEVDRAALAKLVERFPQITDLARENRAWQQRVLRWLVTEAGVDQFLDLGSGLPTQQNTHEVVQAADPECRVVYVDNDPAVAAFGRALLSDDDRTWFLSADLTDPERVLGDPVVADHLDFDRPVAVVLAATMHFVDDDDRARRIVAAYQDVLAPGSYLALGQVWQPPAGHPLAETMREIKARYAEVSNAVTPRTSERIMALLDGLEPVPPGLVSITEWWPEGPRLSPVPEAVAIGYGVLARKP